MRIIEARRSDIPHLLAASQIIASVVMIRLAYGSRCCSAERVTLAGSRIPILQHVAVLFGGCVCKTRKHGAHVLCNNNRGFAAALYIVWRRGLPLHGAECFTPAFLLVVGNVYIYQQRQTRIRVTRRQAQMLLHAARWSAVRLHAGLSFLSFPYFRTAQSDNGNAAASLATRSLQPSAFVRESGWLSFDLLYGFAQRGN